MTDYKSADVQRLFNVSSETVRRWAQVFEDHLSPSASPGEGRTKLFTADDLRVFALVAEMKNQGKTYDDIHVALKAGQLGDVEEIAQERAIAIETDLQIDLLQSQIRQLRSDRESALTQLDTVRGEAAKWEAEAQIMKTDRERLMSELDEARLEIRKMEREMGKLEARLEMLQEDSDKDTK